MRREFLKMRQHINAVAGPAVAYELGTNKITRRQKSRHTLLIRPQPTVYTCFDGENSPGRTSAGITVFRHNVPGAPALASFANFSSRHQIVGWTQQLEIIQVIEHRNATLLQFPKNRRREVMIDFSPIVDIGAKLPNR